MATKRMCTSLREMTRGSKESGLFPETVIRCEKEMLSSGSCPEGCEGYVDKLDLAFNLAKGTIDASASEGTKSNQSCSSCTEKLCRDRITELENQVRELSLQLRDLGSPVIGDPREQI